ncbi:MAG: TAXI family TRAP transporter solute-binding subunit [Ruminococcaceae bacterium]|nr:TAXI family TRAP transporter solute-binding subunit [Oscillospiraceae bacterium]MBQ9914137.1 TAXI family TRAP transporter solute-binding subunit [Clostridia bacterium]
MKKLLAVLLAALMLFTLAACGGNGDGEETTAAGTETTAAASDEIIKTITAGTGGTTGTYYAFTTAVGQILNTDAYTFNVISTGGSQANIEMIADGEAQFAIVQNDVMNYAYEGTNGFAEAITDFSAVACVYSEVCQLVATKASGITSLADLKGKTVAVGDVGSGVYYNATQILEAAGLDIDKDINKVTASFGDSATQLKDGSIDAAFITAGAPTTAITDLATTTEVVLVDLGDDIIDSLIEKYPFYEKFEATADNTKYDFVTEAVSTVAIKATFVVSNKMSEDQVYQITKDLWEKQADIAVAHAKGNEMVKENAVAAVGKVPVHPGAEKYYKEIGVIA